MNEKQSDIRIVAGLNTESTEALIRQQLKQVQDNINNSGGIKLKLTLDYSDVVNEAKKVIETQVSGTMSVKGSKDTTSKRKDTLGGVEDTAISAATKSAKEFSEALKKKVEAEERDAAAAKKQAEANSVLAEKIKGVRQELEALRKANDGLITGDAALSDQYTDALSRVSAGGISDKEASAVLANFKTSLSYAQQAANAAEKEVKAKEKAALAAQKKADADAASAVKIESARLGVEDLVRLNDNLIKEGIALDSQIQDIYKNVNRDDIGEKEAKAFFLQAKELLKAEKEYQKTITDGLAAKQKDAEAESKRRIEIERLQVAIDKMQQIKGLDISSEDVLSSDLKGVIDELYKYNPSDDQSASSVKRARDLLSLLRDRLSLQEQVVKKEQQESHTLIDVKNRIEEIGVANKNLLANDSVLNETYKSLKDDLANDSISADEAARRLATLKEEITTRQRITKIQEDEAKAVADNAREMERAYDTARKMEELNPKMRSNEMYSQQFDSIVAAMDAGAISGKEANFQLEQLQKNLSTAGLAGKSFSQTFDDALKKFAQYLSVSSIMLQLVNGIKNMIGYVRELDSKMVDLQIASGLNNTEIRNMINSYHELGQQLGATTVEVAQSADTWLRQGFSAEEANELIADSMMLSKLGQIEADEAAKALTSSMKGYGVAVEDATAIVDKFTAVDMAAATSAGDIATAMAETAVGADVAGVSMDRLIGYITQVAEVTQDAPESVGTFFRTLFARMGNIKSGRLIDPETEESLSDVETTLSGLGIQLRTSEDEFRNFGDVLDEVAEKWDTFSSVQQRAIAVAFSGTRQQERFLVLMEGYDDAMNFANISADSLGTASEKYDVYLNSMEAKMNSFKSALYDLSDSVINSDLLKGIVDFGSGFVGVITDIVDAVGILPTVLGTVGLGGFIKNFNNISSTYSSMASMISQLGNQKLWDTNPTAIRNLSTALGELSERQRSVVLGAVQLSEAQQAQIALNRTGLNSVQAYVAANSGLVDSFGNLKDSSIDFKSFMDAIHKQLGENIDLSDEQAKAMYNVVKAQTAMNEASGQTLTIGQKLKSVGIFNWVSFGVTIFTTIIGLIDHFNQKQLESAAAASQAAEELQAEFDTLDEQVEKMTELQNSIRYGNLSIEEAADARIELMGIQDEIIAKYGVERDAIDGVTASFRDQALAIKQAAALDWLASNDEDYRRAREYMTEDITRNLLLSGNTSQQVANAVVDAFSSVVGDELSSSIADGMTGMISLGITGTRDEILRYYKDVYAEVLDMRTRYANTVNPDEKILKEYDSVLKSISRNIKSIEDDSRYNTYSETFARGLAMEIAANKDAAQILQDLSNIDLSNIVDADSYEKAVDKLNLLYEAASKIADEEVSSALRDEIDKVYDDVEGRKFEIKIKPEILESDDPEYAAVRDILTIQSSGLDGLDSSEVTALAKQYATYGKTVDEVSAKTESAIKTMLDVAEKYGVGIEDVTALMVEMGLVAEDVAENVSHIESEAKDVTGSLQQLATSGGESLSSLESAIATAMDWRSTKEQVQAALDTIYELTGIRLDIDAYNLYQTLDLISNYVDGNIEGFYKLLKAEMDALGIKLTPSGITGAIQQIITMAARGVVAAGTLLETLKALGAVEYGETTSRVNARRGDIEKYDTSAKGQYSNVEDAPKTYGVKVGYKINTDWIDSFLEGLDNVGSSGGGGGGSSSREDTTDYWLQEYETLLAELDHARAMDYISEEEYYNKLEELANEYLKGRDEYLEKYRSVEEKIYAYRKQAMEDMYEEQRDAAIEAAEAEYDARVEALEAEQEAAEKALQDRIDLLDKELDAYKDLIDQRKRLLDDAADERSHDRRVEELNEEIANIQSELDAIALDDSAKANAQRVELREQLLDKQRQLEDEQYDWSVDTQKDALDKEYERYEQLVNDQQALLQQQMDNLNTYYQMQIDMAATLKDQIIEGINSAFDGLVMSIQASFQEIVVEAEETAAQVESIFSRVYDTSTKSGVMELQTALVNEGYNIGNYGTNKDGVDGIIGKKTTKALVMAWQEYLNSLGANLKVDGIRGTKTKAAEKQFGVVYPYHTGGVVGKEISGVNKDVLANIVPIEDNEVLAKLLKNELVLTEQQQDMVRGAFNSLTSSYGDLARAGMQSAASSVTTNNSPSITVQNVFEGDVSNDTVRRLENWASKFKRELQDNMFGTMNKHNVFGNRIPVRSY